MYNDGHGKRFGEHSSVVLFDPDVGYDSEDFEGKLEAKLEKLNDDDLLFASEIDIGGGADWPVVAIEVITSYLPHATVLALFFSGDRILKNVTAWREMAGYVLRFLPKSGFANRNGAAAILLGKISENFEGKELKLLGYQCFDRQALVFSDIEASHEWVISEMQNFKTIDIDQYKICHGPPIHAFRILIDGSSAVAIVEGAAVTLYMK